MSAMMTGVNTNQGVLGFGEATEANDFNRDATATNPDAPRAGEGARHESRRRVHGQADARNTGGDLCARQSP
jgi:hypothetical protein